MPTTLIRRNGDLPLLIEAENDITPITEKRFSISKKDL
jgi:hypothetical protein